MSVILKIEVLPTGAIEPGKPCFSPKPTLPYFLVHRYRDSNFTFHRIVV
jgi:hypothetical protein